MGTVIPLILSGLERGERCVYLSNISAAREMEKALRSAGIDVNSSVQNGALIFRGDARSKIGKAFSGLDDMLHLIADLSNESANDGFKGLRIFGEMSWGEHNVGFKEHLQELESRLNDVVEQDNIIAIWQYNFNTCSQDMLLNALRTNPLVFYDGLLIKNSYYMRLTGQQQAGSPTHPAGLMLFGLAENKRWLDDLLSMQSKLNAMLESIGDHIVMIDRELNVIWANKTARSLFGEDIVGRKCYQTYHGRSGACPQCIALESFEDGNIHEHDHLVKDNTGKDLHLHCIANIVRRNGGVDAVIEISRDITDKKLTEFELLRSKQTMQTILDTMPFGVVVIGMDRKVRYINKAAKTMSEIDSSENISGRLCNEILCPATRCPILDDGTRLDMAERNLLTKSGKLVPILKTATIIEMDGEEVLLESFVDISLRKHAEEQLRQSQVRYEEESKISASLLGLSRSVSGLLDIGAIAEEVSTAVQKLTSADRTAVFLRDDHYREYRAIAFHGLVSELVPILRDMRITEAHIPRRDTLMRGCSVCIDSPSANGGDCGEYVELFGLRSVTAYPLMTGKGMIGALVAERGEPFTNRDKNLLTGASAIASTAIENALLYKESLEMSADLARRIETVETTYAIDRVILSALDREEILEVVARNIQRIMPADKLATVLYNEDSSLYELDGHTIPFGACPLLDSVMRTGRMTSVPDIAAYRDKYTMLTKLAHDGFKSIIILPIHSKEKRIGCIMMAGRRIGAFDSVDIENAEKLTAQMSIALDNAKLYEDIKDLFMSTVRALAHAIDAKSTWTRGHSERVTEYAVALGKAIGMPDREVERLELAGLLHDIGKIGTYDVVLDKPGKLTKEEFELVKQHPVKGEEILKHIKQMKDIIPAIRHHHEKIDGSGYPDGLRGDEIPLHARILCIADSYDSMTADRPYRPAPGKDYAVSELKRCSGTQFDPELAAAFLRILENE